MESDKTQLDSNKCFPMFFSKTKRVRPKIQGKFSSKFFCNFKSIQDQSLRLELIYFSIFFLTRIKWKKLGFEHLGQAEGVPAHDRRVGKR